MSQMNTYFVCECPKDQMSWKYPVCRNGIEREKEENETRRQSRERQGRRPVETQLVGNTNQQANENKRHHGLLKISLENGYG